MADCGGCLGKAIAFHEGDAPRSSLLEAAYFPPRGSCVARDDARALRWGAMSSRWFDAIPAIPVKAPQGERAPSCCLRDRALRQRDQ